MESDNTMSLALTLINEDRDTKMYENYHKRQEYDAWRTKLYSSTGLGKDATKLLVEFAGMTR